LISKHQQVQLLEAASVLVAMNADGTATGESDHSSASPAASGSSDSREDGMSSVNTTPPPDANALFTVPRPDLASAKRHSSTSSAYSQSYSSVFSDASAPTGRPYISHYRQWSTDGRPTTSGTSVTGSYPGEDEQADLAAAVGLLSCSHGSQGTPKNNAVMLPADVPPVPPLPAKYGGSRPDTLSASTTTLTPHYQSATGRNYSIDVEMDDGSEAESDHYREHAPRGYDEDEGVFGKMEE
jgi:hypothetical protein